MSRATTGDLTPAEDALWRSLGRAVHRLPRRLDTAMVRATGVTMTEYAVLQALTEAPDHRMRMTDLAAACGLSPSRVSRVVDGLAKDGLAIKEKHSDDARSAVAVLTGTGLDRTREARAQYLAIARREVLDLIDPAHHEALGDALRSIAEGP
ncbi:MarR family winged helix-turn-helix transcriptional regulator [Winogradskya humida]|uniref:MarR family transcriptional regulator n=1 Tax=Winogradskya humida TaxID=113566 RepID=A0ABQ3ZZF2_9ACTN|nr:MarR family transcriptional regulator [Actinoplanes humidus]GIE23976.1 MarR family transcriptional regulator [Actinoplanes humidus]